MTHYSRSGVDVEAGDKLVDWLQESHQSEKSQQPHQSMIVDGIGGFASLFRFPLGKYQKPCLVTCTDGVGTKVKLASQFQKYSGIGQDLVAMCVNDLICTGGDPYLFLDYYAVGQLRLENAQEFLKSVKRACVESDCALVGGETAEMPGVYHGHDFDCAGFAVGVVDEDHRWGAHLVQKDQVILALASSGFHSNGYSLLRRVFESDLADWADRLLIPTQLYVKPLQKLKSKLKISAAAHITGGGIDNLPRVLPEGLSAELNIWEFPEMFQEVQTRTGMSQLEMLKTLNCGVGMMLILSKDQADLAQEILKEFEIKSWICGKMIQQKTTDGYLLK